MMHLTMDEIIDLAEKFSAEKTMSSEEIEALHHIKVCRDCYEKFSVAVAICDATSPQGVALASELLRQNEFVNKQIKEPLSVIKVVRHKIDKIRTAIMEQINEMTTTLCFEPTMALATRGGNSEAVSGMVKLEELDDENTFVAFDVNKNELYVQISTTNFPNDTVGIYLLCEDKQIIEVPVVLENGLIKGRIKDIPEVNFKIFIDEE